MFELDLMHNRVLVLSLATVVAGCGGPVAPKTTASPTTNTPSIPAPKIQDAPSKITAVELLEARLATFKNASNGKMGQEVLTIWKNIGETSVRVVDADISALNADGSIRETFNYTLYAEFDDSAGVSPSETYTTDAGRGFKLPGFEGMPGYSPAASVKVRVTKVAERSGM